MPDQRFTIYEASNETLKELYVGMTSLSLHQVMTKFRGRRPPEISHWNSDHAVSYQIVESSLAASHAADFVVAHAAKAKRPGWTVIAGSPGFGQRPSGSSL